MLIEVTCFQLRDVPLSCPVLVWTISMLPGSTYISSRGNDGEKHSPVVLQLDDAAVNIWLNQPELAGCTLHTHRLAPVVLEARGWHIVVALLGTLMLEFHDFWNVPNQLMELSSWLSRRNQIPVIAAAVGRLAMVHMIILA